jgi:DNA-binding MarR family transcriptional regulator
MQSNSGRIGPVSASDLPRVWQLFGEDRMLQRLLLLARMIDRVSSRQLQASFGLSVAQWRVLAYISMVGSASASGIRDASEVDQAEVSRAVSSLLERGLVSREFLPGNRQKQIITLTPEGQNLCKEVRVMRGTFNSEMTEGLSQSQKADFEESLSILAGNVAAHRNFRRVRGL